MGWTILSILILEGSISGSLCRSCMHIHFNKHPYNFGNLKWYKWVIIIQLTILKVEFIWASFQYGYLRISFSGLEIFVSLPMSCMRRSLIMILIILMLIKTSILFPNLVVLVIRLFLFLRMILTSKTLFRTFMVTLRRVYTWILMKMMKNSWQITTGPPPNTFRYLSFCSNLTRKYPDHKSAIWREFVIFHTWNNLSSLRWKGGVGSSWRR